MADREKEISHKNEIVEISEDQFNHRYAKAVAQFEIHYVEKVEQFMLSPRLQYIKFLT